MLSVEEKQAEIKGDDMSDESEQRDRFDLWWDKYSATALRVSTDGGVRFALAENHRSVAKKSVDGIGTAGGESAGGTDGGNDRNTELHRRRSYDGRNGVNVFGTTNWNPRANTKGEAMKPALTMTDILASHRKQLQDFTQTIGNLNQQVNTLTKQRDALLNALRGFDDANSEWIKGFCRSELVRLVDEMKDVVTVEVPE